MLLGRCLKKATVYFAVALSGFFLLSSVAEAKFINTFISRIGGNDLQSGDEVKMAKYDIIFCNKFHYDDIRGDTWGAVKDINPNTEIYVYSDVVFVYRYSDDDPTQGLNNLGRYNNSRGHSMGSLNGNHPSYFLLDENSNRIQLSTISQYFLLDFGNSNFHDYSVEATITDHANRPWSADGVYSDHTFSAKTGAIAFPSKYNTNSKWSAAMNSMINAMTAGLNSSGQKFAGNRGPSYTVDGYNSWLSLDSTSNPIDVALEEAAFAVGYGPGDIQFYSEPYWKRQVDLLRNIKNSKLCFLSTTELPSTSSSGTDNWGKSFTYWDALWYSLGSYSLGKNDTRNNSYFSFIRTGSYNSLNFYYDEYDYIDLGKAVSVYEISNIGGRNIYWREFENGYVYVNPTPYDVTSISLPEPCKQITHSNFKSDIDNLPTTSSFVLRSHRAAFFYKSNYQSSSPPSPPPVSDASAMLIEAEDGYLRAPMEIETDANASSGEYIWTTTGTGGYAAFNLNIPESGSYFIWGRVLAPHEGANSFFISTDNGSNAVWHIPSSLNWKWDLAASAYFNAGQHTIYVKQRENGTQLDQILITNDPDNVQSVIGSSSEPQVSIEAEDGYLRAPMEIETDANASSGEYIWTTPGTGGYASFNFNIPESGNYFIWGRVLAPHAGANSFLISTDSGSDALWDIPTSASWKWDMAFSSYYGAGQHTIIIKQRELRTQLDKILITKDPDYFPNY